MRHLLRAGSLSKEQVYDLFALAKQFEHSTAPIDEQLFVGNLFMESSTRTKTSFTVAERKLGLEPLSFTSETSSMTKGESLYDTVKTFESIGANMLIIRHEQDDWMDDIAPFVNIPIVNAGAGKAEHPTQSLLDAYTIYKQFSQFTDLNIVISGDIKYSRVAHSNIHLLQKLGANIYLSAPDELMDQTLDLPHLSMDEAVERADCLMLLRVQHERHEQLLATSNYLEQYGLTKEREQRMKDRAIIMHPAPVNRGVEIDGDLVECDRSRIFKQMENGVYVRMAIMKQLLINWGLVSCQSY
ncbi:MAG TPA: aspartate carbamoyltransferase catalytic subunit [Bacillota bacterium]|nr:aspartate carbamoyltransferase catalytic subunit [Bacillota bacterium]